MSKGAHPLHAVAEHPTAARLGLSLEESRDGAYVRLSMLWPMVLFKRAADPGADLDRIKFAHLTLMDVHEDALANGPSAALADMAQQADAHRSAVMQKLRAGKYRHPLGDDHPFLAIHALAQDEGLDRLKLVIAHDGALMRLYDRDSDLVFKRTGDPGSAIDRQRFDYCDHKFIKPDTPQAMLAEIKRHIAQKGST
jgi:hypothetical protein